MTTAKDIANLSSQDKAALIAALGGAGAATTAALTRSNLLAKIRRCARHAQQSNPRTAGLYTAPLTITSGGITQPAATSGSYPVASNAYGIWHVTGGQMQPQSGGLPNFVMSATFSAGVLGASCSRWEAMADARYVALKLQGPGRAYRLLIDGQYVAMTPSITTANGSGNFEWWLLDFGSRAVRRIVIEVGAATSGSVFAAATEPTGKMWAVGLGDAVHGVFLGDSYEAGTGPTFSADCPSMQMADRLGIYMHSSGVGGTGWGNPGASRYTFSQRLGDQVNDIALSPYAPDIIFLKASVNDRAYQPTVLTPAALTGLQLARANNPYVPIIVFGTVTNATSQLSASPSMLDNELAVKAAVTAFNDPFTAFVPITSDANGAWVTGSGRTGATTNDGNADWFNMADSVHPTDEGAAYLGLRYASGALKALASF